MTGGGKDMSDVCMLSRGPSTKQSWSYTDEDDRASKDTDERRKDNDGSMKGYGWQRERAHMAA